VWNSIRSDSISWNKTGIGLVLDTKTIGPKVMTALHEKIRIAAVGDLHCPKTSDGVLRIIFDYVNEEADILLLCGDLTDYGKPEEASVLAKLLSGVRIPMLGVLGNHDYESGKPEDIRRIMCEAGVVMLDGDSRVVHDIGFVGAKGFAGGFGDRALQPWGEEALKQFVRESVDEAMKLESALAKVQIPRRIVLMHYAPIAETTNGEPPEIVPFLGSSHLEDAMSRFPVIAAFHGHAHHGSPEGRTKEQVPIYNVALPLLQRTFPNRPPVRILEVPCPVVA
jgi:Icc-related predicted phosphoesterase